jgi:hypothetical protein
MTGSDAWIAVTIKLPCSTRCKFMHLVSITVVGCDDQNAAGLADGFY